MGSPLGEAGRSDDEKLHPVTISKPFYMGKYHVTVGQFREFAKDEMYTTDAERLKRTGVYVGETWSMKTMDNICWKNPGFAQSDDEPVLCISWNDTQKFVEWLSLKSRKNVHLPTEAQWEYGCRASTKTPFNTGVSISTEQANFNGRYSRSFQIIPEGTFRARTTRVGSFNANAFGLYDMHGNAIQWCQDLYRKDYETLNSVDPVNNTIGKERMTKGFSWGDPGDFGRTANRIFHISPDSTNNGVGFRIVIEP